MKEHTQTSLSLKLQKEDYSAFFPLLQKGIRMKAGTGDSVKSLLCGQFNVSPDYLEERVKTIFIDGKPVDDVETAIVFDGAVMALSAAMPGLVGATMRRGSILASFRSDITYHSENNGADTHEKGIVTIKLFNLLMSELGPILLEEGVWMSKSDMADFLKDRMSVLRSAVSKVELDGLEMTFEQLKTYDWSDAKDEVCLRITV